MYYIPSILGGSVAIAVLWKAVFSKDGLLNTVLRAVTFGLAQGPEWLSDPHYALWIICFLRIWQFGSAMVLFLAALKGVPADLYEAATIDGAGKWRQFFSDVYKRQAGVRSKMYRLTQSASTSMMLNRIF